MLTIAYSRFSSPSARRIAEQGEVTIVRSSTQAVEVNWGRATANARLNADTSNATNKRVMRNLFAEHGVPMPRLLDPDALAEHLVGGGSAIGRPDRHSKGRGLWMVWDLETLQHASNGTRRKRAATHFMEYVHSSRAPREYRVHIFQGRSIRISRKEPHAEKGWVAVPAGDLPLATVRAAGKAAVAALGLDFGAVDVLAGGEANEDVWVLEVNSAPGLGGTMPKVYFDTFTKWKHEQA